MPSKSRAEDNPTVEVDRAVAAVRRAIGRLARLLGEQDEAAVKAAAGVLFGLGGRAIAGPLAAALPRAKSPWHRAAIVGLLASAGPEERSLVIRALLAARKRERDPRVAAIIQVKLVALLLPVPGKPGPDPPASAEDRSSR